MQTVYRHVRTWLFAAAWMFYLKENLTALRDAPTGWQRDVGLVALAAFAVCYLRVVSWIGRSRAGWRLPVHPWVALGVLLALTALQVPAAGYHAATCFVFIAAAGIIMLPFPQGVPLAAALAATSILLSWTVGGWRENGHALAVVLGSAASAGFRLAGERQNRLRTAEVDLAVADERTRIAGDLHDILGHSLTVVAIKAELAQRLLDTDVERARAELRDLEALARDALSDVRATALGVRGISLPGEIAAAREALHAANVTAELPGAADDVPTRNRELFAWTLREAVTNVVRHAHATRVTVHLTPTTLEILDNGGGAPTAGPGQGLAGLRRRAEALGGTFAAGRRADHPGFRVRVEVPA